jgi:hypothetical protein
MPQIDTAEWIDSHNAAQILTANSGHPVSNAYVRRLAASGVIRKKMLHERLALYSRIDAENYKVRELKKKRTLAEALIVPWRLDIMASAITEKVARSLGELDEQQKEALSVMVREELRVQLQQAIETGEIPNPDE